MKTLIARHKAGEHIGICSVCSAHPLVIEAALAFDRNSTRKVLIEATSNQVNQFGGYTGMTPADFREFVFTIADKVGFARERIILGGDHLGAKLLAARKCGCGDGKIRRAGKGICSCRLQ
ncbi:putative tagatose 6-phosphate kinase [Escherichia coli]|uniref:Putative tagatose 6-phosphate kinase n=1 Tax=Escherichia coli TaxID=562 RepID=A0A376KR66_ECOLX|nr:putative tagatose 6-phosphate kinase [Escherichia coli]